VLALLRRDAGAGIADAHGKVAIACSGRDAHLTSVRELDGVTYEIEQHLGQALLVAEAIRQCNIHLEGKLLGRRERLRCHHHRLDNAA